MIDRILNERPLPDILAGEIVLKTPNLRVVTDYKPGLEGQREGASFFIEPLNSSGEASLLTAAVAHNFFTFNLRPVLPHWIPGEYFVYPCLQVDYSPENLPPLFQGAVLIPEQGKSTVPSPQRMETCITQIKYGHYTFADDLPENHGVSNPYTRRLRLMQTTSADEIPDAIVHSDGPNPWYKIRTAWWFGVVARLDLGVESGEFSDPGIIEEIQAFGIKYHDLGTRTRTAEDIAEANRIITLVWNKYGKAQTP